MNVQELVDALSCTEGHDASDYSVVLNVERTQAVATTITYDHARQRVFVS